MSIIFDIVSVSKNSSPTQRLSSQPRSRIDKSDRTRTALQNAALDYVWTRPFRDMTVSSVTGPAGVSRSAFYHYFNDLHELMEALLVMSQDEIFAASAPWIAGVGDPVVLIDETFAGLVRVCYRRGPFLRAVVDAATTDDRFEAAWSRVLGGFDDAACARIEADQKQGLIPDFDARPVAFALNRLDAYTLTEAFGRRPRSRPEPVREALVRIWVSTLYGSEWAEKDSSNLVRT